jgi:hypothetical protein
MEPTRDIPLTQGYVAIVDAADYDAAMVYKWCALIGNHTVYAKRAYQVDGVHRTVQLHTFLTGWPYVDHVNGNGLDNRRDNLRPATRAQNQRNARRRIDNTSGFKGVSINRGRWQAVIRAGGTPRNLGRFDDPESAARAYDAAARELHGEYATLNFPQLGERSAL